MILKSKIAFLYLLGAASCSLALTLGPLQGTAVVGQALDVTVQLQLDATERNEPLCFEAEVFHADLRQDPGRVRTVVEKLAQPAQATVRILSSTPVDEPVVSINLRTSCGVRTARRYVLLADLAEQLIAPITSLVVAPAPTPVASLAAPGTAIPKVVAKSAPSGLASKEAGAAARPAVRRVRLSLASEPVAVMPVEEKSTPVRPAPDSAIQRVKPDGKKRPGRVAGEARLQLDPLEQLSDRISNLDSFMTFEPTEDTLAQAQKVKTLEDEVRALREVALRSQRGLAEMQVRLKKAEAERSTVPLIYGLAGLVLCCLLAVLWLWSRQRGAGVAEPAWWSIGGVDPFAQPAPAEPMAEAVSAQESSPDAQGMTPGLNGRGDEPDDSVFSSLMQGPGTRDEGDRQSPGKGPAKLMRSLNSDAILVVRAQADNLIAAAKTDRAVAILRKQIGESDEPNPFVYLDLLTLFHTLDQKNEFQQCRQDFNLLFNGKVPEFAFFKDEGRALEAYPEVMDRIIEHWPTVKTLEVIEACVFRDPWASGGEPFDLAAMRDLMLLHGVAQSLVMADATSVRAATGQVAVSNTAGGQIGNLDIDFQDSVASSFPALSKSALADLFGRQAEPPPMPALDLDLSDFETGIPTARPALAPLHGAERSLVTQDRPANSGPVDLDILLPQAPPQTNSPPRNSTY